MAIKLSTSVRNAMLEAIEATIGASAKIKLRSGAAPAGLGDADTGDVLATIDLPSDWMQDASSGQKVMEGTWEDVSADATGSAGHFRVYESDGITPHMQGSITATGAGGDMQLDNTSLAVGQQVTITSFTWTAPNG